MNMQGELKLSGVLEDKIGNDAAFHFHDDLNYELRLFCFPKYFHSGDWRATISEEEFEAALNKHFDPHLFFDSMKDTIINGVTFEGYDYDIKEVTLNTIDYLLNLIDER